MDFLYTYHVAGPGAVRLPEHGYTIMKHRSYIGSATVLLRHRAQIEDDENAEDSQPAQEGNCFEMLVSASMSSHSDSSAEGSYGRAVLGLVAPTACHWTVLLLHVQN